LYLYWSFRIIANITSLEVRT